MRCRTHAVWFTLHPVGFVPYGREPITSESGSASCLVGRVEEAAAGELWPSRPVAAAAGSVVESGGTVEASNQKAAAERGWRSTQAAHVCRAAMLTGVSAQLDGRSRPRIGRVLGVDTLLLREQADEVQRDRALEAVARSAWRVLVAMVRTGTSLFERLAAAGHLVGLWGPVSRCDGPGRPLRALFPSAGRSRDRGAACPPMRQRHD